MKSNSFSIKFVLMLAGTLLLATTMTGFSGNAQAEGASLQEQSFFKKKYSIKGTWSLVERDGKQLIVFSKRFKTKNGPDLKVFLSPKSAKEVNGKNAVDGALQLGVLQNNKGAQEYEIPEGTDLSQYASVLVHCEAYSVLWGGGSLAAN